MKRLTESEKKDIIKNYKIGDVVHGTNNVFDIYEMVFEKEYKGNPKNFDMGIGEEAYEAIRKNKPVNPYDYEKDVLY